MIKKWIVMLGFGGLLVSCDSESAISAATAQRTDSLVNEVLSGRLPLKTLAESKEFMYFDRKYLAEENLDLSKPDFPKEDKVRIQVVAYRIFKAVKLQDNQYVVSVAKGADLHIPQTLFSAYRNSLENGNAAARKPGAAPLSYPINFQDSVLTW